MRARTIARELCPPLIARSLRMLFTSRPLREGIDAGPTAEFETWDAALAASTGYQAQAILMSVVTATEKVVSGEAAFERDSVTFPQMEYPFSLVAGLLLSAIESGGRLRVLDFGGSLGSSYRQCRSLLSGLRELQWMVVEQEHFVRTGKERFETRELSFHLTPEDAANFAQPDVVLLSSSLQYVRDASAMISRLARTGPQFIVIDRTPFTSDPGDRIVVQHVQPSVYRASYPCWLFSRNRFLETLGHAWEVRADYPCPDAPLQTNSGPVHFSGMLLRRRQ